MAAGFVTLAQAKAHLRIATPADDPGDVALQDQIDRAEAVILDYLKDDPPTAGDLVITQAVLLTLAELDRFRGDDEGAYSQGVTAGDLSPVVTNLLRRHRTPAIA
jgi:hypothetical protein